MNLFLITCGYLLLRVGGGHFLQRLAVEGYRYEVNGVVNAYQGGGVGSEGHWNRLKISVVRRVRLGGYFLLLAALLLTEHGAFTWSGVRGVLAGFLLVVLVVACLRSLLGLDKLSVEGPYGTFRR